MQTMTTQWEDEENNRILDLAVSYRLSNQDLQIDSVTPAAVTFLCNQTGHPLRKIGVHTDTGRRHLLRKLTDKVTDQQLAQQVSSALLNQTSA